MHEGQIRYIPFKKFLHSDVYVCHNRVPSFPVAYQRGHMTPKHYDVAGENGWKIKTDEGKREAPPCRPNPTQQCSIVLSWAS